MQPNGIHDSYNRVFAISEPKLFCQVFSQTIRKALVLLIFDDSMHLRKKGENNVWNRCGKKDKGMAKYWPSSKLALVATVKETDTTLRTLSSNGLHKRWKERSLCW